MKNPTMKSSVRTHLLLGFLGCGALFGAACTITEVGEETPAGGGGSLSSVGGSAGRAAVAGTGGVAGSTAGGAGVSAGTGGTTAGAGGASAAGAGGVAGTTAGAAGAGGQAELPPDSLVRFAHFAPDVAEVDICFRPFPIATEHVVDWATSVPYFRKAGAAKELGFPRVSTTIPIDSGKWELRVVDGAATTCGTALAGTTDQPATFVAGTSHTVAFMGLKSQLLYLKTFADPPAAPTGVTFHTLNALTNQGPAELAFLSNEAPPVVATIAAGITAFTDKTAAVAVPTTAVKVAALVDASNPPAVIASVPDFTNATAETGYFAANTFDPGDRINVFIVGSKLAETDPQLVPEVILCFVPATGVELQKDGTPAPIITSFCTYGSQTK